MALPIQPNQPVNQPPPPPDFDVHELSLHVRALELRRNIDEERIKTLETRVSQLEAKIDALLTGHFVGDLRIDGKLTVRDDIVLVSR